MLTWHFVTSAEYKAAAPEVKTGDKLYFLSDTKEIYRGTVSFSESIEMYTGTVPTTPAVNKIYIDSTTLEGKTYSGSAWTTVIRPVDATVAANSDNPVSGKAVAAYVATAGAGLVSDVTYSGTSLSVTKNGKATAIPVTGLGASLTYEPTTGILSMKDTAGSVLGTTVNLGLEKFIQSASYDAKTKKIKLVFNDATPALEIDVGDLVDVYTAGDSTTVGMTVAGNKFTAAAKIATDAGNTLSAKATGLYVPATDISGKTDLAVPTGAGEVATLTASGNLSASGKKIGGATLAATPNASTVATEAAVEAIRAALVTSIGTKMTKLATGKADEVLTVDAAGSAQLSGKKIGGAALAATADANTLATEVAVKSYVTATSLAKTDVKTAMSATSAAASDTQVLSEKSVISALEWKTTV